MEKLLSVGKILNFHGIQGEVKVGYTVDKQDQLAGLKKLYAVKDSITIPLTVTSIRFHKQFALIKFKEINSVNEVMELKGAYLKAPKCDLEKYLEKDEFYIDDLIGMDVFDTENNYIGKISIVSTVGNNDMLTVKDTEGGEHLVPFNKELVPEVDTKGKKIIIKRIPGLLEEMEEAEENDEI